MNSFLNIFKSLLANPRNQYILEILDHTSDLIYKFTNPSVRPWVIGRSGCFFYARTGRPITDHRLAFSMAEPARTDGQISIAELARTDGRTDRFLWQNWPGQTDGQTDVIFIYLVFLQISFQLIKYS